MFGTFVRGDRVSRSGPGLVSEREGTEVGKDSWVREHRRYGKWAVGFEESFRDVGKFCHGSRKEK